MTDVPTCPQSVDVSDVSAERCRLNWKAPRDDGGSEVIGEIHPTTTSYLKVKVTWIYIAPGRETSKALDHGSTVLPANNTMSASIS